MKEQNLEKGIPYKITGKRGITEIELDRDAMDIQAYKYRKTNLKLQRARIILSSISIIIAIAIFIFWVSRG